ncbi:MAG: formylglycine-generating enzyme family protein, partial [Dolichospermum sp.]
GDGVTLEMVAIPGGTFKMGSPENEEGYYSYQSPQHQVTVPPFFMGKHPVTQKQWRAVAALGKVNIDLKSDPSYFKGDNLPVERVSWNDAQEFC